MWTKSALNVKVCFFAFSHFNKFFGTHGHIPAIFNFLDLIFSALSQILKAVCLSVDWVPKLILNIFPTMEHKLVQRCETEVVADTCNASCVFFGGSSSFQQIKIIAEIWKLLAGLLFSFFSATFPVVELVGGGSVINEALPRLVFSAPVVFLSYYNH